MRLREVGVVVVVAADGNDNVTGTGFSGDGGPATKAELYFPTGVAVDGKGSVYIADRSNYRVRKVSPGGTITTVAGTGKAYGALGDGGPATSAYMDPWGVAVDGQGNLYIADVGNDRVRKVTPGGTITTFAGGSQWTLLSKARRRSRAKLVGERSVRRGGGRKREPLHRCLRPKPYPQGLERVCRSRH